MSLGGAIIWTFATIALIAGAFWAASALNRAHLKPRDLADEDEPCSDWDGLF
jgi:hypothetical protein